MDPGVCLWWPCWRTFWKKLHILFFCIKGNVYKFGAERPTSHFGGHVGVHFGKRSYTHYSFVTKVMRTKVGAERPTPYFSEGKPLEMVAMLAAILGKC